MAKYDIVYSCGHAGVVQLYGKGSERERAIKSYEMNGLCDVCVQQRLVDDLAKARARAIENGYAQLVGTDKQIVWADEIRWTIIQSIVEKMSETLENAQEIVNAGTASAEEIGKCDKFISVYDAVLDAIKGKKYASWWIDNRLQHPMRLAKSIEEEVTEKLAKESINNTPNALQSLAEATVTPDNCEKSTAVEIAFSDNNVTAKYPYDEGFQAIVKGLGYKWDKGTCCWKMDINYKSGGKEDRAAELGNSLLRGGYPIIIHDADVRRRAINADFEPACTRWIISLIDDKYNGMVHLSFPKDQDLYDKARKIRGSKWANPYISVPVSEFEMIYDFAELYGFMISNGAQRKLETYRNSLLPPVSPVEPIKENSEDKLATILESSRDVLEELIDETDY